jgi:hypothetical protein
MISHRVRNYVSPYVLDTPVLDAQPTMSVKNTVTFSVLINASFCPYPPP